ncbi:hypothetical protein LTR95_002206 [Oleoguttula sp. CCFEE 5521]
MDDVVEGFASWTLSDALSDMDVAHQRSLQQGLSTAKANPLDTPEREYQPIHSRSATQPNIPARNLAVYRTNMEESDPCFRAGTFCTDASLDVKWNNSKRCGRQATRDANLRLLHSITAPLQSNPEALINREAMLDWRRSRLGWGEELCQIRSKNNALRDRKVGGEVNADVVVIDSLLSFLNVGGSVISNPSRCTVELEDMD